MGLFRLLWCLVLALVCASPRGALAAGAFEVGVAPATRKVLPDAAVPATASITLRAARNEWEGFQIVVRGASALSGVDVALGDLCSKAGQCISAQKNARLYREHLVTVKDPSPFGVTKHERKAGRYPDPLIPFVDPYGGASATGVGAPFSLPAAETGAVFVDIYVPPATAPGSYAGTAKVTATGQSAQTVAVTLEVWAFSLPEERTVATAFGFSESSLRAFHGGSGSTATVDMTAVAQRYYAALHEHRIDPTTVNGPVSFKFDAAGKLQPVDWTAYDAAVSPWLDGSKFGDGVPVTRFNVGRFRPGHGLGGLSEDQFKQAARAFAEHLKQKGWWKRAYVYALDEPWLYESDARYAKVKKEADLLFAASPLWKGKVLVTGPFDKRVEDRVGIWCPVTPMYDDWWWGWEPKAGWKTYTDRFAKGESLWFYVCNANTPPYAGYDIDTTIGFEPRMVKWGTFYERATGFLYWRVSYWVDNDPWNKLLNIKQFTKNGARNGDGFLLYPGDHDGTAGGKGSPAGVAIDGPVLSYRLKQVRDGLEDWELFILASKLGGESYVRSQVRRAYSRFGDFFMEVCDSDKDFFYCPDEQPWTLDETVLADVRHKVAQKVLYLTDPKTYPDPEKVAPDAGVLADGGADATVDAGTPDRGAPDAALQAVATGGGGCSAAGSGGGGAGVLGLWALLFALRSRRRRR